MSHEVLERLVEEVVALRRRVAALETHEISVKWVTFSPSLDQGGTVAATVVYARYALIGKTALVQLMLQATAAGTAGNAISVASIPAAIQPSQTGAMRIIGTAVYRDVGTAFYALAVEAATATTWRLFGYNTTSVFGINPAVTIASPDQLSIVAVYEVA